MSIFNSIILGILQGVGEFLPISSSAHLVLYPYLFNIPYQGLVFDVMLHLGTFFAIFIYFFNDLKTMAVKSLSNPSGREMRFMLLIAVATIPGAVAGLLLEKDAETIFRSPVIISSSLIFFSILIYLIDRRFSGSKEEYSFNFRDAIIAGAFQSIAIIPGASRSAMTIIALLILGYSRHSAARISFFMAMPIIFGAGLLEIRKLSFSNINIFLIVSFIFSFISGIMSIRFFLEYLKKKDLSIFVFYRIILALLVLIKVFYSG